MNLLKTAAAVSGLTLLSRVTGLIREILTAGLFGAGPQTDAFFVAFRIPNLLRRLFAEGAFTQAFVPVLGAARRNEGDDDARRLVQQLLLLMLVVLMALSALAMAAAPAIVWAMTGGFDGDALRFGLTVELLRIMFPYIVLISLTALASGALNTWGEFRIPAFTPVLLNLAFIGGALLLAPRLETPIFALAISVMVGGVLQLGVQLWALHRHGLLQGLGTLLAQPWKALIEAARSPTVRRILTLMLPASLAVSVAQLSLIINTYIAAGLPAGSVSWLSYADRLMEFPTALLGVALGTVLLPALTRANADGDAGRTSALVDWGLRLVFLLALPAMVGLAVLAEPLAAVLFHYGAFTDTDVHQTQFAMQAYAAGLVGLIAIKVLAPAFYAQQNVRTPVLIALVALAATQALNLVLVPMLAHAGLALATSLAALLNAGLLLAGLLRSGRYRPSPGWGLLLLRLVVACALLGLGLGLAEGQLDWIGLRSEPLLRVALLFGILLASALVYFGSLWAMGLPAHRLLRSPPNAPVAASQGKPTIPSSSNTDETPKP